MIQTHHEKLTTKSQSSNIMTDNVCILFTTHSLLDKAKTVILTADFHNLLSALHYKFNYEKLI